MRKYAPFEYIFINFEGYDGSVYKILVGKLT